MYPIKMVFLGPISVGPHGRRHGSETQTESGVGEPVLADSALPSHGQAFLTFGVSHVVSLA